MLTEVQSGTVGQTGHRPVHRRPFDGWCRLSWDVTCGGPWGYASYAFLSSFGPHGPSQRGGGGTDVLSAESLGHGLQGVVCRGGATLQSPRCCAACAKRIPARH